MPPLRRGGKFQSAERKRREEKTDGKKKKKKARAVLEPQREPITKRATGE